MPAQQTEGHKLFVGDLPADVSKDELQTIFSTYGEVINIHLMSPHPRSGERCAFVFYTTAESAEDSIKVLNGLYRIRVDADHPIKVEWAKEKHTEKGKGEGEPEKIAEADGFKLHVGGLPLDCKEDELKIVFGTYGEVNKVHLMAPHTHSGRVAAFVFYLRSSDADDAVQVLDGIYKIRTDAEHPIQVKWATRKEGKGEGKQAAAADWWGKGSGEGAIVSRHGGAGGGKGGGKSWNGEGKSWNGEQEEAQGNPGKSVEGWKLFVGGLPSDVLKDELESVFSTYGEVNKVHVMTPHSLSGRVAAFIFYDNEQAADDAIKVLDGQYKIREDAETPIQVRWASEKLDKGTWGGKGDRYQGDYGKGSWSGHGTDGWGASQWSSGGHKEGHKGKSRGGKAGKAAWQNSWEDDSWYDAGDIWAADDWHDQSWNSAPSWQDNSAGWYGKGGDTYGKSYDKGGKWGSRSKGDEWHSAKNDTHKGGKGKHGKGDSTSGCRGAKGADKGKDTSASFDRGEVSDTKLFVGNLPDDISEDALQYVFRTYGTVNHIHIMSGKSKTGQACAFIEYTAAQGAETAAFTLNGKYEIRPGYGPLKVKKANSSSTVQQTRHQ